MTHCQYYTNKSHPPPTPSLRGGSAPKQSVLNHKTSLKPNYAILITLQAPSNNLACAAVCPPLAGVGGGIFVQLIDNQPSNNLQ